MTIGSVEAIVLSLPFDIGGPKPLFAGKPRNMDILLVRVETDSGLVGWGEAFGFAVWPATRVALDVLVAPLAIGRDERDIAGLMAELQKKLHLLGRTGPVMYALSGLDIALWDIAGKKQNRPLVELLGGPHRMRLPTYASLLRYGDPELVAKNAARAVARGFRAIKLHEITEPAVRAAREAIGPDVQLMVDTNCPWTLDEARAVAASIRPHDIYWFEEPIWPPEDYPALAKLRLDAGMPIAAGENATSFNDFERMLDAGAVDIVQPSVTKIGGVTEMKRIARLATVRRTRFVPHSPYFGPGLLATVHIAAALRDETMIEYSFADLGANPLGDAIEVVDGDIAVPEGPGLGRDPDPAIIARYRVE
ncbi:MAG: mandelate racemase/muconate lactonizing enzyme family protein [Burkholderiales bacterium]